jgi:hypothetical protein
MGIPKYGHESICERGYHDWYIAIVTRSSSCCVESPTGTEFPPTISLIQWFIIPRHDDVSAFSYASVCSSAYAC